MMDEISVMMDVMDAPCLVNDDDLLLCNVLYCVIFAL